MSTKSLYVKKVHDSLHVIWRWNKKPLQMDHCASGKTQGFKSANCLWILHIQQQKVKINCWGMKVIGTKSLASQLRSPPLIVGKIQSSKLQSSSPSSTALTSRLLIFKGGPPARARRTTFWVLEVKPRPNLSDLYGISGSCPQIVHPPSSTDRKSVV